MSDTHQVLIIGPAWVGDMVMAQSLFMMLQKEHASTHIDVLAPAWSHPIIARMPEVSEALEIPFKHGEFKGWQRFQFGRRLREQGYDQAIVLPNSWKSGIIPWAAKIPKRTGWLGEARYGLLNDCRRLDKQRYTNMVQRFAALGLPAGAALTDIPKPHLVVSRDAQEQVLQAFALTTEQPILALCPGAEFGRAKQWPPAYYARLAEHYLKQSWQVWLLGSPNDKPAAEAIGELTQHACVDLVGRTNLPQAIDLLSMAQQVVANDSGLMHIASALHKPILALYGSTDPTFAPPLTDKAKSLSLGLSCGPCAKRSCPLVHHACMINLTPNMALAAIEELQHA